MQRVGTRNTQRGALALVASVAALVALSACTSATTADTADTSPSAGTTAVSSSPPASPSSTPVTSTAAKPATLSAEPALDSKNINPATPVTVKVTNGTLLSVRMVNPAGKTVAGSLASDGSSWKTTEALGYAKTYRLTAVAKNGDGTSVTKHSTMTTLAPDNQTEPTLERTGGYALGDGLTYGVGIVPIVHFDEPITDEAAAQKALTVTTSPHVAGAWYWSDNQNANWRPENYWPSGTKVTVAANVYGVKVGHGLYGSTDAKASFTIGARQVTIAQDNAPKVDKVRVYRNGTLVRTMNTSMGEHSGETVNGQYISFFTMQGTYTVLEHDNPAIMSSASYGLPANAPGGYAPEPIYYSTKISTDGIYLHELETTTYAQDNGYDVSHGCLNLNTANATWFYNHSTIGDPVEIEHTGGPTIQYWQGGAWSIPWSTWVKGGATT